MTTTLEIFSSRKKELREAAASAGIQRGLADTSPLDIEGAVTRLTREDRVEALNEGRESDRW